MKGITKIGEKEKIFQAFLAWLFLEKTRGIAIALVLSALSALLSLSFKNFEDFIISLALKKKKKSYS